MTDHLKATIAARMAQRFSRATGQRHARGRQGRGKNGSVGSGPS